MWTYQRSTEIEVSLPSPDRVVALKPHLHTDVQILVVTSGSRAMRVGPQRVTIHEGSVLVIQSGIAHCALDDTQTTWSGVNLYVPPSLLPDDETRIVALDNAASWLERFRKCPPSINVLYEVVRSLVHSGTPLWTNRVSRTLWDRHIMSRHDRALCRESRIRRFKSAVGITPHAYTLAVRLDRARQLLAAGGSPADIAADLGFADQSHLGRQFRAAFGTTPGRYADALSPNLVAQASQSFQTGKAIRK